MARNGNCGGDAALIVALAGGQTIVDAAQSAGLSLRTAHRRLADAGFRQRILAARRGLLDEAMGRLANAATEAVTRLRDLAETAESENVQLGAARAILDALHRWREAAEFDERLSELEGRLDEMQTSAQQIEPRTAANPRRVGRG